MRAKQKSKIISIILVLVFILEPGIVWAAENQTNFWGFRTILSKIINGIDNWLKGLIYFKEIQEENNILIFQNRSLKSLLIDYQQLKAENELLKKALEIKQSQKINFILANIVGRSPLNFSQTFVIDIGENEGAKIGQAVVWGGKTLVGEIIDVRKNSSTVRVLIDSEFKAAVFIGEKRIEALLKGNGFLSPYLDLVPAKEDIEQNEQIYTSGLDNKFIKGLYIGDVMEIEKPEGKIFQEVKIKPALDWTNLYQVLVITNEQ